MWVRGELRVGDLATCQRSPDERYHERPCTGRQRWASGPIALTLRRLKIIDLSDRGVQPMVDPELGLAIVLTAVSTIIQSFVRN